MMCVLSLAASKFRCGGKSAGHILQSYKHQKETRDVPSCVLAEAVTGVTEQRRCRSADPAAGRSRELLSLPPQQSKQTDNWTKTSVYPREEEKVASENQGGRFHVSNQSLVRDVKSVLVERVDRREDENTEGYHDDLLTWLIERLFLSPHTHQMLQHTGNVLAPPTCLRAGFRGSNFL